MIKITIEINGKVIRTIMANRLDHLTHKEDEAHIYHAVALNNESKKKVEFKSRHEYKRGALRLAEKLCGAAARKL